MQKGGAAAGRGSASPHPGHTTKFALFRPAMNGNDLSPQFDSTAGVISSVCRMLVRSPGSAIAPSRLPLALAQVGSRRRSGQGGAREFASRALSPPPWESWEMMMSQQRSLGIYRYVRRMSGLLSGAIPLAEAQYPLFTTLQEAEPCSIIIFR